MHSAAPVSMRIRRRVRASPALAMGHCIDIASEDASLLRYGDRRVFRSALALVEVSDLLGRHASCTRTVISPERCFKGNVVGCGARIGWRRRRPATPSFRARVRS